LLLVAPPGHDPSTWTEHTAQIAEITGAPVILLLHGWTQAQIDAEAVRVAVAEDRKVRPSAPYQPTEEQAKSTALATFGEIGQLERDVIEWLHVECRDLRKRIERSEARAREMLRDLEWRGGTGDGCSCCPACGAEPERGTDPDKPKRGTHAADCKLAALLTRGAS
jgi:hypothetical protein